MKFGWVAIVLLVGCHDSKPHVKCTTDAQCTLSGRPGTCLAGACTVVDLACPSGRRYDTAAGGSGDCVPLETGVDGSAAGGGDLATPEPDMAKPECTSASDCANGGQAPCGGTCTDGRCTYPGPTTDCGSTCLGSTENAKTCDGHGSCAASTLACGVYQCGATTCKTSCTNAPTDCNRTPCTEGQCVACPGDMVYVPAGAFTMGHNYPGSTTDAQVAVTLTKSFCLDKYEVTVAQYRACVTAGACTAPATSLYGDYTTAPGANEDLPVGNVTWSQANTYCTWSGLGAGARRLPTEAEWERGARGVDGRTYPWGEAAPDCTYLDFRDSVSHTCMPKPPWLTTVGTYAKGVSPTGIFDAAGNALEFTADCWVANYTNGGVCSGSCSDPVAPSCAASADHTARGGSSSAPVTYVTTYYRYQAHAAGEVNVGFRCAK